MSAQAIAVAVVVCVWLAFLLLVSWADNHKRPHYIEYDEDGQDGQPYWTDWRGRKHSISTRPQVFE